jgi:hypothetical protein
MPRKPSGKPKQKPPRPLNVANHLPTDDGELFTHCTASWAGFKADTVHFPSLPNGTQIDAELKTLGDALPLAANGSEADKKTVKTSAGKLRAYWGQLAKYATIALRALPIEETPPILASVLMTQSHTGQHKPKPPIVAEHGTVSGVMIVTVLAIAHALTYTFEWSLDQQSWSSHTQGKTRATIEGLTPGKVYWFRVRALLRDDTTTDPVGPISKIAI